MDSKGHVQLFLLYQTDRDRDIMHMGYVHISLQEEQMGEH